MEWEWAWWEVWSGVEWGPSNTAHQPGPPTAQSTDHATRTTRPANNPVHGAPGRDRHTTPERDTRIQRDRHTDPKRPTRGARARIQGAATRIQGRWTYEDVLRGSYSGISHTNPSNSTRLRQCCARALRNTHYQPRGSSTTAHGPLSRGGGDGETCQIGRGVPCGRGSMRSLVLTALLSWDTARGEVSVGVCLRMCGVGVGGERERTEREEKYEEGRQRRVIAQRLRGW